MIWVLVKKIHVTLLIIISLILLVVICVSYFALFPDEKYDFIYNSIRYVNEVKEILHDISDS